MQTLRLAKLAGVPILAAPELVAFTAKNFLVLWMPPQTQLQNLRAKLTGVPILAAPELAVGHAYFSLDLRMPQP
jgi:hypothetical protein